MRNKKKLAQVLINDLTFPNKGIGTFEGNKVIIKNTIPGQLVEAILTKKHGVYHGKLTSIIEKSEIEIEPECTDFGLCGGCTYQNISYKNELRLKESIVLNLLKNEGFSSFKYLGIEPSPQIHEYKNKMEFSFGDEEKGGTLALGMRKRNSYYEVVTSKSCNIVDNDYRKIVNAVLNFFKNSEDNFYHKASHEGTLRHLIIRKGFFTGEILINLVTTSTIKTDLKHFADILLELQLDGNITGILHTINDSIADIVKCDKLITLYGKDYFYEKILGLKFKISAFSFFQTNSYGTEKLYETIKTFVSLKENNIIFDLYCGTGTIAQIISKNAKQVIGVELIEEAVEGATQNAKLNNIENCEFIAGDVLKVVDEIKCNPDTIILDPPREGIHPKAINKIISFGANCIIYVSCKPTSLVNDLKVFCENAYKPEVVKLHDMFARTGHVETVVLLSKIKY